MPSRAMAIPPKKRGVITLGSPATDSDAGDNGSDGGIGSDSECEEIYKKVDLADEINDLIEDQEYYHDFDSDLEPEADEYIDDDVDDVDQIVHRDDFTGPAHYEGDHEIYGDDEESEIADFPLDYDSEYGIGGSSPRKRQHMSPVYFERDIDVFEIEQPRSARIPDMKFSVNYDEDDVFEILPMRLRKSSDPEEALIYFTELDLSTRPRNIDYFDLSDDDLADVADNDVSDLELDLPPLPETVTIRKPRRQHRRTISDHVPLGDGNAYLYTPPASKTPSKCRNHSIIDVDSAQTSTPYKRRSDSFEDMATPQSPTPTKRRRLTVEDESMPRSNLNKRRSSSIEDAETPAPKRDRTNAPMPTPPNSSHTYPARRVHAPDGSPITAMRMGFTSAIQAPVTPRKQKDWRVIDEGEGFIMSSSRADTLVDFGPDAATGPRSSRPEERLKSGRTPEEEINHLIANSGFFTGLRSQIKPSAALSRNGYQHIRGNVGNVSKPNRNRSVNQRLGNGKGFKVYEDETATMARGVGGIRYRNTGV